ncbi:MAG: hypothetical protein N3E46_12050 [Gemmataceae bacterium]|nr:hypothetical protein [Gemmataceae bacterium]
MTARKTEEAEGEETRSPQEQPLPASQEQPLRPAPCRATDCREIAGNELRDAASA